MQEFHLTDFTRPLESDVDLRAVPADTILHVMGHSGALAAPGQETVSFQPHPKTLTMAGDYEYFAAQVSGVALDAGVLTFFSMLIDAQTQQL